MRHVFGVVVMVSVAVGQAHAQSVDTKALAEQLFNQARDLAKENRWSEACPKFEASLRYDPVLGTRLNLATCYEHIGKLATAWGLYRESIELAKKVGDAKRAAYAQKQATALESRLPKLAISAPANPPPGFTVKRDDTLISASEFGTALYVDPGAHTVTASAPGFEALSVTVTLLEGRTETLAIPALSAKPVPAQVTDSPKPPTERRVEATEPIALQSSRVRKYVAIGMGGAGVAAVGMGLVFGVNANSNYNDAEALCGPNLVCEAENYDKAKNRVDDARAKATMSTVFVVAGGAAIVASAIVLLTAPRRRERATTRIVPVSQDRGAGLTIVGRF